MAQLIKPEDTMAYRDSSWASARSISVGVKLEKVLAKQVRAQLNALTQRQPQVRGQRSGIQFQSSTSALLEYGIDNTRRYVLFAIDMV